MAKKKVWEGIRKSKEGKLGRMKLENLTVNIFLLAGSNHKMSGGRRQKIGQGGKIHHRRIRSLSINPNPTGVKST